MLPCVTLGTPQTSTMRGTATASSMQTQKPRLIQGHDLQGRDSLKNPSQSPGSSHLATLVPTEAEVGTEMAKRITVATEDVTNPGSSFHFTERWVPGPLPSQGVF